MISFEDEHAYYHEFLSKIEKTDVRNPRVLIAAKKDSAKNYCNALLEYGMEAEVTLHFDAKAGYDALLLPGGGDIEPSLFGQENFGSNDIDIELDLSQLELLSAFVHRKMPILCICKGFQLLNVFFGGTLKQAQNSPLHMSTLSGDNIHEVTALKSSVFERLYGSSFRVNSAHHQSLDILSPSLLCSLKAADGTMEGVVHPVLPILGVQWHPERMCLAYGSGAFADGGMMFAHFRECISSQATYT